MPYNLGLADTLTAAGVNDGARVAELCLQEECSSLAALAELTPALLDRLVSRAGLKSLSEARFRPRGSAGWLRMHRAWTAHCRCRSA